MFIDLIFNQQFFILFCFFFALISSNCRYVLISINFFRVSIHFTKNKVLRIYTITFLVFSDRDKSNIVNTSIFIWLFIYFDITWIKTFYIDNVIKKVVCEVFNVYIFNSHFTLYYQNRILCNEMFLFCSVLCHVTVYTNSYQ